MKEEEGRHNNESSMNVEADATGASANAEILVALSRLKSALARDLETIRQRQATAFAAEQPLSFQEFLYTNEEVVVPQHIVALRAKRSAITHTMMPPEEDDCE
ncbi:hypothetical protein TraAM80_02109 [Trypanosoma rangeli]|uniref:Uncharacterized protein n=1 Tax=Trypanosoma rangeli TaxID=5698 RepID=A0A422NVK5_TRYRA|nr:uncharacterized protein TraAM80_02109 [Trypanosoma rangeli]RNF09501.1 hypothetical protein TraAM80_02109 [Trypanosoma rangeli]|eukprot:RNF09501.1 hypothetical protein TraAM80_02109 [Trypanosoma rangeli]